MRRPAVRLPPWAHLSAARRQHVERVAVLVGQWADVLGVPATERDRWLRAVALHDALKDAPAPLLHELAPDAWGVDALRHGPAAAVRAAREGETDRGVLDAVRYHSVGFGAWDAAGRMLYLGDYLEPGRAFARDERSALAARVPEDPAGALREVARRRIGAVLDAGLPLLPETVDFWNALTCGD